MAATSWGVRNIGADLVFGQDVVYAFDTTTEVRLLSNTGLSVTYNSVHCLSQRSGGDVWGYVGTGTVHVHAILDKKAFFVLTEGTPMGTPRHPVANYRMCVVDRKLTSSKATHPVWRNIFPPRQVRRAMDAGLNLIDTAPNYEEGTASESWARRSRAGPMSNHVSSRIPHFNIWSERET